MGELIQIEYISFAGVLLLEENSYTDRILKLTLESTQ